MTVALAIILLCIATATSPLWVSWLMDRLER